MEELQDDLPAVERRMRVAKAAQRSTKNAPVGLQIAYRFAVGIAKARAIEKAAPRGTLNVAVAELNITNHNYPEIEVEK